MNWKQLFNLKGTNFWLIGAALGWNVIWTFGVLTVIILARSGGQQMTALTQVGLLIGSYLGPFSGGWVTARMAGDGRGPTYGLVGSLSSALLLIFIVVPSGRAIGLMAVVVSLAGGFIGGALGQPRYPRD